MKFTGRHTKQNMAETAKKWLIIYGFLASLVFVIQCSSSESMENDELRIKSKEKAVEDSEDEEEDGPCMIGLKEGLARLNGVKVGHVVEKDLGDKTVKMITRAMKPPIFEIPNFLSDEECNHIIHLAEKQKMLNSMARGGLTKLEDIEIPQIENGKSSGPAGRFYEWDNNHDGIITFAEVALFAKKNHFLVVTKNEILDMFHVINVTEMDDGKITFKEFQTLNTHGIDGVMHVTGLTHPKHRHRYSEQTWIDQRKDKHNPVLNALQERILKLTGLSKEIIYGSERIQVVRYTAQGHYHAHYDSETHTRTEAPCCHQVEDISKIFNFKHPCRLCRYMTILYYLNDVKDGGQTAFPVADNTTLNRTKMEWSRAEYDHYNLNENCKSSNLAIEPKKGLAVMWYNHLRDENTGWMGAMDDYSLHGGCGVNKGIKWIANNWITAPYPDAYDKKSIWLSSVDIGHEK